MRKYLSPKAEKRYWKTASGYKTAPLSADTAKYGLNITKRLMIKGLLLKPRSEIYRQHRRKHFQCRQGINNFVSVSVQLHWHWLFKKTPLTWDICTNLRTCSVKRPCIDRIYNVQVVIRVQPTPRRGGGVSKERGSHEGENLRDRERGCQVPCPSLFGSFPR